MDVFVSCIFSFWRFVLYETQNLDRNSFKEHIQVILFVDRLEFILISVCAWTDKLTVWSVWNLNSLISCTSCACIPARKCLYVCSISGRIALVVPSVVPASNWFSWCFRSFASLLGWRDVYVPMYLLFACLYVCTYVSFRCLLAV